jgi:hypothetical protein
MAIMQLNMSKSGLMAIVACEDGLMDWYWRVQSR